MPSPSPQVRHLEESLREAESRFQATFELAPIAIAHVGTDGRFLRVNRRYCELLGYDAEELCALRFQDVTHPDDLAADLNQALATLAGVQSSYRMVKRYVRKDGALCWVELQGALVRVPATNEPLYFIAVADDITQRVQAEAERERRWQELESQRDAWASLLDRAPVSLLVVRGAGHVVEAANARFRAAAGGQPLLGRAVAELFPAAVEERALLDRVYATGEAATVPGAAFQAPHDDTDEAATIALSAYEPLRGVDGAVSGVMVAGLAATRQLLPEGSVRSREALLRTVLASTRELVLAIYDGERRLQYVNPRGYAIGRTTPAAVLGRRDEEVLPPEVTERYLPTLQQAIETRLPQSLVLRFGERTQLVHFVPVTDAGGAVQQVLALTLDASAREQVEAEQERLLLELTTERERFSVAMAQAPAAIMLARGAEHRIHSANELYRRLAGGRELVGRTVREAFPELQGQGFFELMDRVFDAGEPYVGREARMMVDTDGDGVPEEGFFDVVYEPLRDAAGQVFGVLTHSVDVTDRVLATRRVALLQALTSALAGTLTPADVVRVVVERIRPALSARYATLLTPTPDGGALEITADAELPEAIQGRFERLPLREADPVCEAYRTGEVVQVPSPAYLAEHFPEVLAMPGGMGARAMIAIAMEVDGRRLGVLAIGYARPRRWFTDELDFLRALARQCAQALERARLYDAEASGRTRTARLQTITAMLAGMLTPAQVADVVARQASAALGAHLAMVAVLDDQGGALQLLNAVGCSMAELEEWRDRALEADGGLRAVLATGRALWLDEQAGWSAADPALTQLAGRFAAAAWAVLPLAVGDSAFGCIVLGFPDVRRLTDAERAFALTVAQQGAQALERARLYAVQCDARRAAEEANRSKADFLTALSHSLRTPLNSMVGYTELLSLGIHGPLSAAQREALTRIGAGQHHLSALINDILAFAALEAGHLELRLRPLPVRELLHGVSVLVAPLAQSRGVEYSVDAGEEGLWLIADEERARQCLLNLVDNAVELTPAGGQVTLACGADERWVYLRVQDDGPGIPGESLQRIFEPFVQLRDAATAPAAGVGLGLTIGRDLARAMGGFLGVRSEPGAGSTFTLALPRTPAPS